MNDNENKKFGMQGEDVNSQPVENISENDNDAKTGSQSENAYSSPESATEKTNDFVQEPINSTEPDSSATQEPPKAAEPEPAYSPYSQYNDTYKQQPYSNYNAYSQNNTNPYQQQQATINVDANKKKSNKGFKAFIISLVAVVVCVAVVLAVYPKLSNKTKTEKVKGDSTQLSISETPSSTAAAGSTEEIAANAKKINVGILLYGKAQSFSAAASSNSLVGEGSGIIMGEDSTGKYTYIITCAHVISEVKTAGYTMTVQDYEGNTYDGIMVGYDSKTDVGVIKVQATGLTSAKFGDSSALAIGQTIYAIGNPGGTEFFGSFTNGVVSAIDRPISSESGYEMKCIQHTAAINSGNSGGALLNASGQVVGINSSKIVSTGYEGMAFSIPITEAKSIIDDIIANGYVTDRPKLGISYAAASNYQQYSMVVHLKDLPSGSLIIASISNDSSLAKTDAKVGDLITAVDGKEMTDTSVLLDKIENGKVGDTLKLTLCRINDDYSINTFDVTATLVEDTGTSSQADEEQTTTQNYWEQYFNGSGNNGSGSGF